jgi:hypothetical protein
MIFFISDQLEPVLLHEHGESSAVRKFIWNERGALNEENEAPKKFYGQLERSFFLKSKASVPYDDVDIVGGKPQVVKKAACPGEIPLRITKTGVAFITGEIGNVETLVNRTLRRQGNGLFERADFDSINKEPVVTTLPREIAPFSLRSKLTNVDLLLDHNKIKEE